MSEELFIKSGLAKSAFTRRIYGALPWHYFMPYVDETQKLCRAAARFAPKVYQAHDAFMMFHQPYEAVYPSLKKSNRIAPIWHAVVKEAVNAESFLDLNSYTRGSAELAIVAAYSFLRGVFASLWSPTVERAQEEMRKQGVGAPGAALEKALGSRDAVKASVNEALRRALEAASSFREGREDAEAALRALGGAGGSGFSKEALSVLRFLQNPDEFRKRVRLLKYARFFLHRFSSSLPVSLSHEQVVSQVGGLYGVGRMPSGRVADILPSELALLNLPEARALFAVKYASSQLLAYQRAASVKPVVFIDKSGSMASDIGFGEEQRYERAPKISVAAGLALAMHRKFGAPIYLFDTELSRVKPAEIAKTLLSISADGGTDIDPVLDEITRLGKRDYTYVIVSDGITEASSSRLAKFEKSELAARTKLILIPPASESYNWVALLKRHRNVYYAQDVAVFEKAAKQALSG